ncbi:MAG: hypothetical protein RIC87_24000 [Kiloniellales bacterium]
MRTLALSLLLVALSWPLAAQESQPESGPSPEEIQPSEPALGEADGVEPDELEEPDSGRVTGIEALEDLVRGRTHYRTRSDGSFEVEFHSVDGISAYVWEGCVIRGEWWATPEEICFFYPDNDLQGPHCFFIEKGEEGLEFWWSGNPVATEPTATTVRDVEGNSERLPVGVSGECLIS